MTDAIKQRIEQINKGEIPNGYKKDRWLICPNNWTIERLNFYLSENKDKNVDGMYTKDDVLSVSGEYGVVNQIELMGRSYAGESILPYHIVETGDIVYTKSPLKQNPYGIIKLNEGKPGVVSTLYAVYHCENPIVAKYLNYFFQVDNYLNNYLLPLVKKGAKNDMKVNNEDVLKGKISFPPLEEQQKIAEILMQCDKIIELYEQEIEEFKKLKKVYLRKMFPQKGKNVPELRFDGFTDPWEQRKLGDIVGIYDGIHQTPNYQDGGIMFLSVENIATLQSSKFISEEDFKRDYKVYPQENDILMTRIGDVGTTNVVSDNGLKAYYVSLALLKYKNTNPFFLSNAIQSDFVQNGLANRTLKTAIPMKINKDEIGKVDVMLPVSADEQQQIGTYFRNLDYLITLHQRKLEEQQKQKKSLMQLLLTGIVRVKI